MILIFAAIFLIISMEVPHSASAEPSIKDLAVRTEVHPIETLTLSPRQFLTGDKNGKPFTIAGHLRFPQGVTTRMPVIVIQHGSGGSNARDEYWAKTFNEIGIASFLVDSFSGRGLSRTTTEVAQLTPYNLMLDAYRAFDILASHPRIDPVRIGIMGFSLGGVSALYSSLKRFQQTWNPRATFAIHIPFYPTCHLTFIGDTDVTASIRQFHGAADDFTPVEPCRAYFDRLRAAGRDSVLTEYPGAHHSFDNPLGNKTPRISKGAQSFRACKLKEEPLGRIVHESGEPFTMKDPCLQRDAHTGYNEAAATAARSAVKELIRWCLSSNHEKTVGPILRNGRVRYLRFPLLCHSLARTICSNVLESVKSTGLHHFHGSLVTDLPKSTKSSAAHGLCWMDGNCRRPFGSGLAITHFRFAPLRLRPRLAVP